MCGILWAVLHWGFSRKAALTPARVRTAGAPAQASQRAKAHVAKLQPALAELRDTESLLESLPKQLEHDVMVPLGPLALTPGRLRHTNEVLCQLSDEYFVWRSADQARGIASRRRACASLFAAAAAAAAAALTPPCRSST